MLAARRNRRCPHRTGARCMSFRIRGLSPAPFVHLYGLSDAELARHGAIRCVADAKPGYPDRVELRDAEPGESLLLVNHVHQPGDTPYRASHAIFVREGATRASALVDEIPDVLRVRLLSVRAFDAAHMMVDADVVDGESLADGIARFFDDARVDYLQVHTAKRGCFVAQVERA
jgi:hypothetical protein